MFPEQRTYSEWAASDFADGGVFFPDMRFGGSHPTGVMETCQDCHMPDQAGSGCVFFVDSEFERPHVPQHSFSGANTWVLEAVAELAGGEAEFIGLTEDRLAEHRARNFQMLRDASDMELSITQSGELGVRVINQSGHKLPTGYPEGRRMWLNVKFFDGDDVLVAERGAYDFKTAEVVLDDTKSYEAKFGISDEVAAATNLPAGESFHLSLNSERLFDNRIPPRGFTNAAFESFGANPVGYAYADGQYWDDTVYDVPASAVRAVVTLYYQTTTKEYIEFLRDANVTDTRGQTAYDMWEMFGKSSPVDMDVQEIEITMPNPADLNGDGIVNGGDLGILLGNWGGTGTGDINGDGLVNGQDLGILLGSWG